MATSPMLASSDAGDFYYLSNFLNPSDAQRLFSIFSTELDWQQKEIRLFGRKIPQPRLTCWYSDEGVQYAYSGLQLEPMPWHPELLGLRKLLQQTLHFPFNSVLGNAYRDGRDSMGWHADDEKELGAEPVIASISLGAERKFKLRKRMGHSTTDLRLEHGSLLVMQRQCQSGYRHSLPKTVKPVGLRINLTFRQVMSPPVR